jgi:hypothetical protein
MDMIQLPAWNEECGTRVRGAGFGICDRKGQHDPTVVVRTKHRHDCGDFQDNSPTPVWSDSKI